MKISNVIRKLVNFDRTERPVIVALFERDSDGNVISKKRYPVTAVFSHEDGQAKICIEQADCLDIEV